jgi:hypothetical protein
LLLVVWAVSLSAWQADAADIEISIPIQLSHSQNMDPSPSPDGKKKRGRGKSFGRDRLYCRDHHVHPRDDGRSNADTNDSFGHGVFYQATVKEANGIAAAQFRV